MSVSRLSELDPTPEHERVQQSYTPPPGFRDESKLDAIVSKAFEQVESQYEATRKSATSTSSSANPSRSTKLASPTKSATGAAYDRR
jgi:hypothetical protein